MTHDLNVLTGARKEVKVQGIGVLLFWYRNELYAIEARYVNKQQHAIHVCIYGMC